MDTDKRLSAHLVWLFALVAVVGGLGLSFVTAKAGWKVSAAVFFGFVGLMAFLGGYLTRATTLQAVGPFVLASGALGAVYYAIVKSVMSTAANAVGAGGRADHAAATMGAVAAFLIILDALAASVGGATLGIKLRAVKSPSELLRRPA
ncbi:MAG: hypothetical protein IPL61_25475 [Myxococcales bacterium]|nr:hypothetical protein [Myxococcales bacterium]